MEDIPIESINDFSLTILYQYQFYFNNNKKKICYKFYRFRIGFSFS